ncbi:DEP1A protein, partial [Bucco capensis]|nr:DEP1A protein [Bucco capensis]
WNEITRYFRAGMPLRKHRQHFKSHGSCFTASEAVDWLHQVLRNNSNFGPEVTRQQTVQLLRKFLKNHVIEDIKGRWGAENLQDNGVLYRFPSASPVKPLPSSCPPKENLEHLSRDKERPFKLLHFSRRSLKKQEVLQPLDNLARPNPERRAENKEGILPGKEISQEYIQETWRNIILLHLQTILGLPSLEEVLQPSQIVPEHIIYNMSHSSKHGVVILQNKAEDLPHWVLSAMKCLAYWPRNNDLSQPTYSGFERDVFSTVADYFLNLPEPLLTFEYYELFVNILVLCGYSTIPANCSGNHSGQEEEKAVPQPPKTPHLNSFKSTECLLLSLLHKEPGKKGQEASGKSSSELAAQQQCAKKLRCKQGTAAQLLGGSWHNLSASSREQAPPQPFRTRCYSLEGIGDPPSSLCPQGVWNSLREVDVNTIQAPRDGKQCPLHEQKRSSGLELGLAKQIHGVCASALHPQQLCNAAAGSKQAHKSLSLLGKRSSTSCSSINIPLKPRPHFCGQGKENFPGDVATSVAISKEHPELLSTTKRLCQSTTELASCSFTPSPSLLTGSQNVVQPHLERVAVEALQICCLLLPPAQRRRLQLLTRMMVRISCNPHMPRLQQPMGNRALLLQTFSCCVLRCAQELHLDELLATRLLSFLMDHQQEIFQVPTYLQLAVRDHLEYVKLSQSQDPKEEICAILPTYSYCKQITPQEFEEQKVSTSQAAVAELLENILKDKNLSVRDKKKKLKQFQKEYPHIYQKRFPSSAREAMLLENKNPTLKPAMLGLRKPSLPSLR